MATLTLIRSDSPIVLTVEPTTLLSIRQAFEAALADSEPGLWLTPEILGADEQWLWVPRDTLVRFDYRSSVLSSINESLKGIIGKIG